LRSDGSDWKDEYTLLVVRRKKEESIVIGGSIRVTILAVSGDRVKVGIEAPPHVSIVREELLDRPPPGEERAAT
jgi:carbon storage regulator